MSVALDDVFAAAERLQRWLDADDATHFGQHEKDLDAVLEELRLLRNLVQEWHYLAVGPDEMGDYYRQKSLVKLSEPYAHSALRAIGLVK